MPSIPDSQPTQPEAPRALSPVATRLWARARREWEQQQFQAAAHSLVGVLALAPDHADALRMLGGLAQMRGDSATAIDCFRRLLATAPDDNEVHVNLGIVLHERGDTDEAMQHLRRACELAPQFAPAWFNLGEALAKQVRTAESADAFQRALELAPSNVTTRLALARARVNLGQIESAVAGFRDVLRLEPGNADAWFGLANLNTLRFDAADTLALQNEFTRTDRPIDQHELLGSAFAKALEDQGDYAQAFDVFRRVKQSQRRWVTGNANGERERVELIRQIFEKPQPAPTDPQLGKEVIFIVSLPRSGSSLVEQILASHPLVEGANEITDLLGVIDAETRRRACAFPAWGAEASADDWNRLGNEYLARTARWRETKPRFTDKHLSNWYLLGAALTMLPAARVVVVRRDPVETCLACYRQYFTAMAGFACDLNDLADYCINFLELTQFWRDQFPDRMFDLRYEALVDEPEPVIRRLLNFCDLPFDSACLDFHHTARAVMSTPSSAQVRQPLRRDTARSERYGDKLDGLRKRLTDAGVWHPKNTGA